ncbi:MAG: AAA family ATPase [Candidatus Omnitrophica bacterium]|nr:AAA family ATPase [Candidatus Omnitrophota bacterium]
MPPMIIGLTGKNGSGKGEVASFLTEHGFHYFSLSDEIRESLTERGEPITRESLIAEGNRLRLEYGAGVLANRILAKLEPNKRYVIDSIRHPEEAAALMKRRDFALLRVTAPQEVRFQRVRARRREGDPSSLRDFIAVEDREARSEIEADQQLIATEELAKKEIKNDGPIAELHQKVKNLIMELASELGRPGWDEYFMAIAEVAARRSNCVKRKVAAVVVKDRRIISTGYNGTPRGTKNCNEGGCPRCSSFAPSGTQLAECLCSHAEENAITQASYHGVSIKDSTIYTTFSPCLMCTKMIINAGIKEVVFNQDYPLADIAKRLLVEAGVVLRQLMVPQGSPQK